jgi:hypothetical protein
MDRLTRAIAYKDFGLTAEAALSEAEKDVERERQIEREEREERERERERQCKYSIE